MKKNTRAYRLARTRRRIYRTCGEWQFDRASGPVLHDLRVLSVAYEVLEVAA